MTDAATEREKALALADRAEDAMTEEYGIWRQSWERNPTLSALGLGVNAIRALRKEIESDG